MSRPPEADPRQKATPGDPTHEGRPPASGNAERVARRLPRRSSGSPRRKTSKPRVSGLTPSKEKIRLLVVDVDGVLTDGLIYLGGRGHELKVFDTKDGHGMRKAAAAGITVCWISGRRSPATARRARELGVSLCYQGVRDKTVKIEAVRRRLGLTKSQIAAIGDDEPDLPLFDAAAISACPADAAPAARRAADVVLKRPGGRGAVREFVELILERNGDARIVTHRPN